ncbi:MAG: DNA-3-methyladenine glycosylase [Bryobacterales bacterium]|nr:DNA-3-methyladenine glycosylase [Bryobacterales bacterium]
MRILARDFYNRDTITVARELLGHVLHHETATGPRAGRIVEVEAYLGLNDLAAHASRGLTPRTKVLFGPPGHAYVYLIYGVYECLNLVAEPDGTAGCVLIRALEPVTGIEAMRQDRPAARQLRELCGGPGRLTIALGISRRHNGLDVTRGELTVRQWPEPWNTEVVASPRVGITQCADWPLRFSVAHSPFVSLPLPK